MMLMARTATLLRLTLPARTATGTPRAQGARPDPLSEERESRAIVNGRDAMKKGRAEGGPAVRRAVHVPLVPTPTRPRPDRWIRSRRGHRRASVLVARRQRKGGAEGEPLAEREVGRRIEPILPTEEQYAVLVERRADGHGGNGEEGRRRSAGDRG